MNFRDEQVAIIRRQIADNERHNAELRALLAAEPASSPGEGPAVDPIAAKVAEFQHACRERGYAITTDDFVSAEIAGKLMGRSTKTMKNWRLEKRPIEFRMRNGRAEYALTKLANYFLQQISEKIGD